MDDLHLDESFVSFHCEKIAGDEFEGVPVQVAVECAIGAAMCAWGALGFAGEFMPIAAQPRELPPDNLEKMQAVIKTPESFESRVHYVSPLTNIGSSS